MTRRTLVCGVGLKGSIFVETLIRKNTRIDAIVTYDQKDDRARSVERLRQLAKSTSIPLIEQRNPEFREEDLVFLVGWQHALWKPAGYVVVFHDSLLPRYRGFAPTVTAL